MSAINADDVIEEIVSGQLRPRSHSVARALHQFLQIEDAMQREALTAIDRGAGPAELAALQRRIWGKIDKLKPAEQSGLRLSICLIRPDAPVDWELAEYLILWARQQGLSEQNIIDALHALQ
ncbi:hypothetical protein WBP07_10675 [Novosphingobium sp. BL-8A]|uniref:hypothetical protein n=1 Tax=Novosphingobium sp. BL-8A TaxID=3127639 RepID=UPI003757A761